MNYVLKVYKNPTGGNPESGTLAATKSGTTTYSGMYQIKLDEGVSLDYGDKYAIVIELNKAGDNVYFQVESATGNASFNINSGESFIYDDNTWYDWKDYYERESDDGNIRIKAYTDNGHDVSPITLTAKTLSIGGDISLNYYVNIPSEIRNASGSYAMMNGNKKMLSSLTQDSTFYSFKASPKNINSTASLYFCDASGNKYNLVNSNGNAISGNVYSSSIVKTAQEIIGSSSTSDNLKNLAGAMLNYGGYTRSYLGTDDGAIPVDSGKISGITTSTLSPYVKSASGTLPNGIVYAGSSLLLETNTTVRHYFSGDVSGCTFELDGKALAPKTKDGVSYVEITGIPGYSLGTPQTLKVTGNGKTFELRYSALSYAQSALNKSKSDKLKNLSKALYNYNSAIKTYFDEKL